MIDPLKQQVLDLEERIHLSSNPTIGRIAAFDLDGTLLMGDIGDAVFAYLTFENQNLRLSWGEYQHLLRTHKSKAYRAVVEAMAGLDVEIIIQATSAVMNSGKEYLVHRSDAVRIPRPRPLLSQFVSLLQELHYQVFVISASNHISVQHIAQRWFNIPPSHAFGIQGRVREGRITSELIEPVPIGSGKAELFRRVSGSAIPLITGTDSRLDLPLLQLTHPQGLSLWVGDDHIDFDVVTENARAGHRFFFVESGEETLSDGF
jgi:phosphoserine phosphatase